MEHNPGKNVYIAFLAAVLIGGTNFIAVSFSNRALPPLFGAALRFSLASLLFFALLGIRRVPLARGRNALGAALYGLLGFGVAYGCLYYALTGLAAGTVSVVMAGVPLFTLLIAAAAGQERLAARGLLGALLTMAGIGVLSLGTLGGELSPAYLLAVVIAAASAAGSSVLAKSFPDVHPMNMNAYGMGAAAAALALGSSVFGEAWALPAQGRTWLALGWLVLLGSVGLFQLFLHIIRSWTASAATFAVSAMPVVAVALGALLLDQPVTWQVVAGGVLVIAAVYLGAISGRPGEAGAGEREPAAPGLSPRRAAEPGD
jgi:drug/metabolite transporter (DMT)-like permease